MMKRAVPKRAYSAVPAASSVKSDRALKRTLRAKRQKIAIFLIILGGLVFATAYVPAGGKVHTFTEISDYNPARDSGCTNSGEGCHGTETSYQNFHDYHPDTECGTCHEYTGVGCIPCHGPQQHECAACHDGSMVGASDCVRLTDPFPNGHYRETTHTAMGTVMDREVRIAADGEALLTCADCHSRDLQAAHTGVPVIQDSEYGEDVGCYECHNDTQANGLEQVLGDWPDRSCEVCHDEDSSAPMHDSEVASSVEASGSVGCSDSGDGCHSAGDIHGVHVVAPTDCTGSAKDGEPGCHDLAVESSKPVALSCGEARECHAEPGGFEPDTSMHGEIGGYDTEHHVAGPRQASATYYDRRSGVSTPCGACHSMSLGADHTRPNATMGSGSACDDCHNDSASTVEIVKSSWEARDTSLACEACHGQSGVAQPHTGIDNVHFALEYSRFGTIEAGSCQKSGCHGSIDVREVHAEIGCAFPGCHTASGDIRGDRIMSCGGTDSTQGTCHTSSERHTEADDKHDATEYSHLGDEEVGSCEKAGCHDTIDVRELHTTDHCYTSGCHTEGGPTLMSCGGTDDTEGTCHTSSERHTEADDKHFGIELDPLGNEVPGTCGGSGCHDTIDVRELHTTDHCYTSGCHTEGGPTVLSCGGYDGLEGACHAPAPPATCVPVVPLSIKSTGSVEDASDISQSVLVSVMPCTTVEPTVCASSTVTLPTVIKSSIEESKTAAPVAESPVTETSSRMSDDESGSVDTAIEGEAD
ncbi:MAG: hypothetical protein PF636_10010 [Actinomycetota bacterium]|jgi:hypothetical protein|nr:hypothetical protein [Actinomycetota bacterium]